MSTKRVILFYFFLIAMLLIPTFCKAVTIAWDISDTWVEDTKIIIIITEPDGTDYRLPTGKALDGTYFVEDLYFEYGQEYKIKAQVYNGRRESTFSNIITYKHKGGPDSLDLPLKVGYTVQDPIIKLTL